MDRWRDRDSINDFIDIYLACYKAQWDRKYRKVNQLDSTSQKTCFLIRRQFHAQKTLQNNT